MALNLNSLPGDCAKVVDKNVTDLQAIPTTFSQACSSVAKDNSMNVNNIKESANNYVDDFEVLIDNTPKKNDDTVQKALQKKNKDNMLKQLLNTHECNILVQLTKKHEERQLNKKNENNIQKELNKKDKDNIQKELNEKDEHNIQKELNKKDERNIQKELNEKNEDNIQRQFFVTVAVEKAADEEFDINIKDEITDTPNEEQNLEDTDKNDFLQRNIVSRKNILKSADEILKESTNIADRMLSIEVKNGLGNFQKLTPTLLEIKIQYVFDQWYEWQKLIVSKFRSTPLFYKCYICEKSWWHYYDFREHLMQHENFELELEEYNLHEANIIAYSNLEDIIDIKHIHTDGDCPKCGKDFNYHKLSNRLKDFYYTCEVNKCYKKLPTCFAITNHEFTYHSHLKGKCQRESKKTVPLSTKKSCELCLFFFYTEKEYESHMHLMHSVRSDIVVPFVHKKCRNCEANFVCNWLHICMRNSISDSVCQYCFRILPSLGKHFNKNTETVCKICNVVLKKQCAESEHLLTHTDKFILVQICMLCEDFKVFLNEHDAFNHMLQEHFKWNNQFRSKSSIYSIIIPKSLVTFNAEEESPAAIRNVIVEELPQNPLPVSASELKTITVSVPEIKTLPTSSIEIETVPISVPEIKIKEEIEDNYETAEYVEDIVVKQEFEYEENPVMPQNYTIRIDNELTDDGLFRIKIDHLVKQENEEQEEYEDDIIRLDYSYPNSIQDSQQENSQHSTQDSSQEFMQDSSLEYLQEEEIQSKRRKARKKYCIKHPKIYTCARCGYADHHKQYKEHVTNACTRARPFEDGTFKCTKCNSTFDTFIKYTDHLTLHGVKAMSCPECFASFSSYFLLLPHISCHIQKSYISARLYTVSKKHRSIRHKCKSCLEVVQLSEFFTHWENHLKFVERKEVEEKSETKPVKVPNVLIGHSLDDALLEELLRRLQAPHRGAGSNKPGCMICHKHFDRRGDCKRHLIEHLLYHALSRKQYNDNLLKCQICAKGFQAPSKYKRHMRDHGNLTIYECDLCDKTFSDSSNFVKHKKLHNDNAYICDVCNKRFQAKTSIEKHVKIHETDVTLECDKCKKIFHLESDLKRHIRSAHYSTMYRCSTCFKQFKTIKEKWDHMWEAHNERNCNADCPICKKSYRKFADLKQHVKTHNLQMKTMRDKNAGTKKIALLAKNGKVLKYFSY